MSIQGSREKQNATAAHGESRRRGLQQAYTISSAGISVSIVAWYPRSAPKSATWDDADMEIRSGLRATAAATRFGGLKLSPRWTLPHQFLHWISWNPRL